jgi:pSer/pThr/pTyr-binding forkhead associated (FHA) protein
MEVTELTMWVARFGMLALMYGFLLAVIWAVLADVRAAGRPAAKTPAAPAPAVRTLVLTGGTPPENGRSFPLLGPIDIGREPTCTISIPSRFISKVHARIYPGHDGWVVEDLQSTNGSALNDVPLTGAQPLRQGDRLRVGDTEFLVQ